MAHKKKPLREVHFVCHQNRGVTPNDNGTLETGEWAINPEHIYAGLVLALHETRAESSYRQGVVLDWKGVQKRTESGRHQSRITLTVRATPSPLPWKGLAAGEKGFQWS